MANERSASSGNLALGRHRGQPPVQQGAGGRAAAGRRDARGITGALPVLRAAPGDPSSRSRARSRGSDRYHAAFTELQRDSFRIDPALRAASWCGDCPKCRIRVPRARAVPDPWRLREIFGSDLLDDARQIRGLRAAHRGRRAQAVRVRRGGAGEHRGDAPARAATRRWRGHVVVQGWWPRCSARVRRARGIPPPCLPSRATTRSRPP